MILGCSREIRLAKEKEKRERDGHIKEGRSIKDIRENSSHAKEYKTVKDHLQFRDLQYSKSKCKVYIFPKLYSNFVWLV